MDDKWKKAVAILVAAAAFAVYLIFAFQLWAEAGTQDTEKYSRLIAIWGGIEALAFAAIGWLFGRQVSRDAIEVGSAATRAANARADAESKRALQAQADAVAMAALASPESMLESVPSAAPSDAARLAKAILEKYRGD